MPGMHSLVPDGVLKQNAVGFYAPKAKTEFIFLIHLFIGKVFQMLHSVAMNFFQRIKRWRRISMRFEKLARNFLAFLHLAAVLVWLR